MRDLEYFVSKAYSLCDLTQIPEISEILDNAKEVSIVENVRVLKDNSRLTGFDKLTTREVFSGMFSYILERLGVEYVDWDGRLVNRRTKPLFPQVVNTEVIFEFDELMMINTETGEIVYKF